MPEQQTEQRRVRLHDALIVAVAISPFWFLAADPTDGDEVEKSAVAAGMCAVLKVVQGMIGGNHD